MEDRPWLCTHFNKRNQINLLNWKKNEHLFCSLLLFCVFNEYWHQITRKKLTTKADLCHKTALWNRILSSNEFIQKCSIYKMTMFIKIPMIIHFNIFKVSYVKINYGLARHFSYIWAWAARIPQTDVRQTTK